MIEAMQPPTFVGFLPVAHAQHVLSSQIGRGLYTIPGINSYTFCYTWCNLHRSQFNKACTQFANCTLTSAVKDVWYYLIGCRV